MITKERRVDNYIPLKEEYREVYIKTKLRKYRKYRIK